MNKAIIARNILKGNTCLNCAHSNKNGNRCLLNVDFDQQNWDSIEEYPQEGTCKDWEIQSVERIDAEKWLDTQRKVQ